MADKYHIGQKVRIIFCRFAPSLAGTTTTIKSERKEYDKNNKTILAYDLDLVWNGVPVTGQEHFLEPVCDGDAKTSWSECAWQPKSLVKG